MGLYTPDDTIEWEAKETRHGGSRLRSTFEETKDVVQIAHMVGSRVPETIGSLNNFGLQELCQFETRRKSFKADDKVRIQ